MATQDAKRQQFYGTSLRLWFNWLTAVLEVCLKETLTKQDGEQSVVVGKSNRSSNYMRILMVALVDRKQSDFIKVMKTTPTSTFAGITFKKSLHFDIQTAF